MTRVFVVSQATTNRDRDSEESAPAEFPPDQPEADLNADGDQYGIEEEEEEEEEGEGAAPVEGEDAAMGGAEDTAGPAADDDAASEAGSEEIDIEDSEEDEEEEEEAEEEGGDDMEMDDAAPNGDQAQPKQPAQANPDVMVH